VTGCIRRNVDAVLVDGPAHRAPCARSSLNLPGHSLVVRADHTSREPLNHQRRQRHIGRLHRDDDVIDHRDLCARAFRWIGRARGLHCYRVRIRNRSRRQVVHLRGRPAGHRLARICRDHTDLPQRGATACDAVHAPSDARVWTSVHPPCERDSMISRYRCRCRRNNYASHARLDR
jgi:hypothetical protein